MYRTRRGITQADRHRTLDAAEGLGNLAKHVTRNMRHEMQEMRREQLRAMGFDIPDEGSRAAIAKLTDIGGSD